MIWETVLVGSLGKVVDHGVMYFFLKMSTPVLFMTVYPIIFKKIKPDGFLADAKRIIKSIKRHAVLKPILYLLILITKSIKRYCR